MTNLVQIENQPKPTASRVASIRGIIASIIINIALPFVIYVLLKDYTSVSDFLALVISSIPPIIASMVDVVRKGHIDLMSGIVLLSIFVSILLILAGGSPRLYLIRESFFTAAFGVAYLISLLFSRPLAFYFARYFATGNVPAKIAWFNSLWQYQGFRHSMRVSTVVWGVVFLLEAAIRTVLAFILTIPQFLLISPFVLYGFIGGLMLWTIWYSRQGRQKAEALRSHSVEQSEL
jgi:hypothetical protein